MACVAVSEGQDSRGSSTLLIVLVLIFNLTLSKHTDSLTVRLGGPGGVTGTTAWKEAAMSGERWVRATWRKEEWQLGEDGIVTLPEGLDGVSKQL